MRASLLLLALAIPCGPALAQDTPEPAGEEPAEDGDRDDEGEADGDDEESERKKRKRERKAREQDPERLALIDAAEEVLNAQRTRVDDDGRLELRYDFKSDEEMRDWEVTGFDRAEEGNKRGRRRGRGGEKGKNLALGGSGLLTHKLELVGDFEVHFKLRVLRSTGESDLVVGVGKAGARFGTQLVKRRSSGFKVLRRGSQPNLDPFAGGRAVTITLIRRGGAFSAQAGSADPVETDKLSKEAEGTPLLFARDMHLVVDEVTIKALVDSEQVNALGLD